MTEYNTAVSHGEFYASLVTVIRIVSGFLDDDVIPDWLLTEQFTLGGRTPVQALRAGDLDEVMKCALETEHGSYI
jgi:hypothetical protein